MSASVAPSPDSPLALQAEVGRPALLTDRRTIEFTPPVLCAALDRMARARLQLPPDPIIGAEPRPETQTVDFLFGDPRRPKGVTVPGVELGAYLIGYCVGTRIPMPAKSTKSVTVTADGVTLEFVTKFTSLPNCITARARPVKTTDWSR